MVRLRLEYTIMPIVLKPATGQKLLRRLAMPEGIFERTPRVAPRDQMGDEGRLPDGVDRRASPPTKRAKTIDFVTDGDYEGREQSYQVYERLVDASDITQETGDKAIGYYDYNSAETSIEKNYARIDSHAAAAWANEFGKSLEIKSDVFQLSGFDTATPAQAITNAVTQLTGGVGQYHVIGRKRNANTPELYYFTMDTMKVADADHADNADHADDIEGATGRHAHENHYFNSDDHDTAGIDRYVITNGTAARNNMTGVIGDSAGGLSIHPTNRFLADNAGNTIIDYQTAKIYAQAGGNLSGDFEAMTLRDHAVNTIALNWGTQELLLGDWTVTAGNFHVSAGTYQHQTISGVTLADWYSGGLYRNAAAKEIIIRCQIKDEAGLHNIKIPGVEIV